MTQRSTCNAFEGIGNVGISYKATFIEGIVCIRCLAIVADGKVYGSLNRKRKWLLVLLLSYTMYKVSGADILLVSC